jgi:hypothetical protein
VDELGRSDVPMGIKQISSVIHALYRMPPGHPLVKTALTTLDEHLLLLASDSAKVKATKAQEVAYALSGLRLKDGDTVEVLAILGHLSYLLANSLTSPQHYHHRLSPQDILLAASGLAQKSTDSEEVLKLVGVVADAIRAGVVGGESGGAWGDADVVQLFEAMEKVQDRSGKGKKVVYQALMCALTHDDALSSNRNGENCEERGMEMALQALQGMKMEDEDLRFELRQTLLLSSYFSRTTK